MQDPDRGAVGRAEGEYAFGEADRGLEEVLFQEVPAQTVRFTAGGQGPDERVGGSQDDGGAVLGEEVGEVLQALQDGERAAGLGRLIGQAAGDDVRVSPVFRGQFLAVGKVHLEFLDALCHEAAAGEPGQVWHRVRGEEER